MSSCTELLMCSGSLDPCWAEITADLCMCPKTQPDQEVSDLLPISHSMCNGCGPGISNPPFPCLTYCTKVKIKSSNSNQREFLGEKWKCQRTQTLLALPDRACQVRASWALSLADCLSLALWATSKSGRATVFICFLIKVTVLWLLIIVDSQRYVIVSCIRHIFSYSLTPTVTFQ